MIEKIPDMGETTESSRANENGSGCIECSDKTKSEFKEPCEEHIRRALRVILRRMNDEC